MFKLGHLVAEQWVEHSHPSVFELCKTSSGTERIVCGVPRDKSEIFKLLLQHLEAPILLLYILHTPRGEGEPGRYQSPELTLTQATDFVSRFHEFLSSDSRFDLWAHSPSQSATLVWDRHNRLFVYGITDNAESILKAFGFKHGTVSIPAPHQHNYRSEFDQSARAVLQAFEWVHTPLHSEDEQ